MTLTETSSPATTRYLVFEETCNYCKDGLIEDEFVDYGSAGGGWTYVSCPRCNGTRKVEVLVEYVPWLHSLAPTVPIRAA